ncbi:SDR family oxidoreductase [Membranicola marinus]|uniref:SDR family oxidoreductase n=1 Tax=Membranihabitans marinus TaxID=1227546 RepID=A0A953HTL3_9BACT|nr:SDR family oxidoreductase [Membranihabitans marinus]MBY5957648.1 SDR family oxidoreductase [Membranihabitans marinus]
MEKLKNKVAYITGGSQGIGLGVARALLDQGMRIAISGRSQEKLDQAVETLGASEDVLLAWPSDVRNMADEENMIQKIEEKWGRLDVLVANAGVGAYGSIVDLTTDQWNQAIDTNLTGVFHSVKASVSAIRKSKGYIITIASLAGTNFFAGGSAYNASKFGLVGFTQAVMLDLRQDDVKVSTIMPGSVATHFNNNTPDESDNWKIQPEDVGKLVTDLLTMHPRTLPSKVEVRPSKPPKK